MSLESKFTVVLTLSQLAAVRSMIDIKIKELKGGADHEMHDSIEQLRQKMVKEYESLIVPFNKASINHEN